MHILLLGATGFIGRHVCAHLLAKGHTVRAAVRDPSAAKRRFPSIDAMRVDLNEMAAASQWLPPLNGIDAVVNCAGVLQSGRGQSAEAIHAVAPMALFDACAALRVRKVLQISAVSADTEAGTEYARTKKAADDHLRSLDLDWVVLRPSLVYAHGSYGGTSVIRGLAGFPFCTPLIGNGDQTFQPIHVDDLAETVSRGLTDAALSRRTLEPVGPETLTLRAIVARTRLWLDLPPARTIAVPMAIARLIARIGDALGTGPIRTTSLAQMEYGNVSDPIAFQAAIGFRPRTMAEAFQRSPSHVQDRWHARLYFLRPALTVALAVLWIGSGAAGLLNPPGDAEAVLTNLGVAAELAPAATIGFSILDLLIGFALLTGRASRWLGALQLAVVAAYTVGIGLAVPSLWGDPYGALIKNIPILGVIAVWAILEDDR